MQAPLFWTRYCQTIFMRDRNQELNRARPSPAQTIPTASEPYQPTGTSTGTESYKQSVDWEADRSTAVSLPRRSTSRPSTDTHMPKGKRRPWNPHDIPYFNAFPTKIQQAFIEDPYLYGQVVHFAHSSTSNEDLAAQIRECSPMLSRLPFYTPMMMIALRLLFPRGQKDKWPEEFLDEMDQLQVMGFPNRAANRTALEAARGDLAVAISQLTDRS